MKKILIVEDDRLTATALAGRLKTLGHSVTVASDAVTGLENAVKLQPDLVLLDISMPAGDGFTVAERIQNLLPTEARIIFLTANRSPGLRERAMQLGAAAFFQKPFNIDDLITATQLALGGAPVAQSHEVYAI